MPFKIYYLDDELDLLDVFAEIFATEKISVTTFSNPDIFLKAVQDFPPDLLVLDYRLPNTTGDRVAMQIKSEVPKALITGDLNTIVVSHFEAIFTKPFPINSIQSFIQKLMQKKS